MWEFSKYKCSIDFFYIGVFTKIFGEFGENMLLFGNQNDTRSITIDAMDKRGLKGKRGMFIS